MFIRIAKVNQRANEIFPILRLASEESQTPSISARQVLYSRFLSVLIVYIKKRNEGGNSFRCVCKWLHNLMRVCFQWWPKTRLSPLNVNTYSEISTVPRGSEQSEWAIPWIEWARKASIVKRNATMAKRATTCVNGVVRGKIEKKNCWFKSLFWKRNSIFSATAWPIELKFCTDKLPKNFSRMSLIPNLSSKKKTNYDLMKI